MKYLLLFLLLPTCATAQTDSVGVQRTVARAGTFNIDTIRLANNTGAWVDLYLTGTTGKTFCRAKKSLYITNTDKVYKIVSNTNPITFTGLTGATWNVVLENGYVVVKLTGTKDITNWKLTRLNL